MWYPRVLLQKQAYDCPLIQTSVRGLRRRRVHGATAAQGLYTLTHTHGAPRADTKSRNLDQAMLAWAREWLAVASDLIPPSRRDASGRTSPTVDQAQPGRPMDAPAHEITSPALSNQGAGPMKPTVGHVKWLVAALTIRRSHCQRYAPATSPDNENLV